MQIYLQITWTNFKRITQLDKLCLEARFRMKKSCLVARLQYAEFFLSYTKSCVQKRLFRVFFGQSKVVLGSTTSTLILKKEKTSQLYFIMIYRFFLVSCNTILYCFASLVWNIQPSKITLHAAKWRHGTVPYNCPIQ